MKTTIDNSNEKGYSLVIVDCSGRVQCVNLNDFAKSTISIGRNPSESDIVVSDSIVSSHHGNIELRDGQIFYSDAGSTNGSVVLSSSREIFLSGNSAPVRISEGTIIRIGSIIERSKLVIMWITGMNTEESLQQCILSSTQTTIGREKSNDIFLDHPGISKTHAVITEKNGSYSISDNSSVNGTMVNGRQISGEYILKDKDVIQLLGFLLVYSGNMILYKSQSEGISVRAECIDKWVGKGSSEKQIINNANLEIKGNEFVAIIGGSGAGKTTIMNVLNGFDTKYQGDVFYNNISLRENYNHLKSIIGYVPQDDVIYDNLTLIDMLRYTAELRMPDDATEDEIEERIADVLDMLVLTEHQDTFIRKMSGGQKKRASIAVELLADPKLFFLDEPTSGLDPGTEKGLMKSMRELCKKQKKTIIMVTHTVQNLHLCDKIIFMGPGGRVCFMGNVDEAKEHFRTDDLTEIYNMLYRESEKWANRYNSGLISQPSDSGNSENSEVSFRKQKRSFIRQFGIVTERYSKLMINDSKSLLLIIEPVLIGLIICVVAADGELFNIFEGTQSLMFAFSCAAIWIGIFNTIQEVCKERSILKREYMANLKLSAYVLSKVSIQIVIALIQAVLMSVVFFGSCALFGKNGNDLNLSGIAISGQFGFFAELAITAWLTIIASMSLGLLVSCIAKSGDKAMIAAPFLLIIQLLFSGILFKLEGAVKTISYITTSKWSVEALGRTTDLSSLCLRNHDGSEMLKNGMPDKIIAGDNDDSLIDMFDNLKEYMLQDWLVLVIMAVVLLALCIPVLKNVAKDGR